MSANNRELTKKKSAVSFTTKLLTTSSTNTTYTAKTGRTTDGFLFDIVVRVNTTSESSMTITLPDGVYYGQTFTAIMETLGGSAKVDVSTTSGDDATQMSAAGGYSVLMWHGSTLGWAQIMNSAT
jgi:hypothetical protein